ncbi:MAG: HNH endonuclease [Gemmataceae bacterium]
MPTPEQILHRLGRLRVDRAKGNPAPHKPLLLLVVLDLAEEGELPALLALTPELAFRFFTYWSVVAKRRKQRPDIRLPFHHMQSDGFWSPLGKDGAISTDRRGTQLAALTSDFLAFAKQPLLREKARRLLIATYFEPEERLALHALTGLPVPSDEELKRDRTLGADQAKAKGREARFRLTIVAAYNYTCALTGYRLTTISAGSIVDAAHIHPFADSRNNEPGNGLALSKNAHWLFDNGLWSLTDDCRIVVATGRFAEESPDQKALASYHGHRLRLPSEASLRPSPLHVAWHRRNRFQGA